MKPNSFSLYIVARSAFNTANSCSSSNSRSVLNPSTLVSIMFHSRRSYASLQPKHHKKPNPHKATQKVPKIKDFIDPLKAAVQSKSILEAMKVWAEMKTAKVTPNQIAYNMMINCWVQAGRMSRALELLEEMQRQESVKPDATTYNTIISGLAKEGKMEEAVGLLARMKGKGVKSDEFTHTSLILGYVNKGQLEKAIEQLSVMQEEGIRPNVVTWSTILKGYIAEGKVSTASDLFASMKDLGVRANYVPYLMVMEGLVKANQVEKALDLLREMRKDGVRPSRGVFNLLVEGFAVAKGDMEKALSLVQEMEWANYPVDQETCKIIMLGYIVQDKTDKAFEVLKEYTKKGILLNRRSSDMVMGKLIERKLWKDALRFATEGRIRTRSFPTRLLCNLIERCVVEGRLVKEAFDLVALMRTAAQLSPFLETYNILIEALIEQEGRDGGEKAYLLYTWMKEMRIIPNKTTFDLLLKGCPQHAEVITKEMNTTTTTQQQNREERKEEDEDEDEEEDKEIERQDKLYCNKT